MHRRYLDPRINPARPDLAASYLRGQVEAERYVEGWDCTVSAGVTALRGERSSECPPNTELLFGEGFTVYEERSGWLWGQSLRDGYVGYVRREAVREGGTAPSHQVATVFAHLKGAPELKSASRALLPLCSLVTLGEESACGRYRRVEGTGDWISLAHVDSIGAPRTEDFVAVAEQFLGSPYLWGGRTAAGLDCSALVHLALAATGILLPRDSDLQLDACRCGVAREVPRADARRGDIAFFPAHVGLMLDSETLLHANATHMAVTADSLEEVIGWVARTQTEPFLGLFRLESGNRRESV